MKKDWRREAYPLGTVRVRQSGHSKVHVIKVTHLGPRPKRWMEYARWWWLKNKGPVPAGMRVVHANGHTLDDRPENFTLMTGGQVALLYVRTRKGVMEKMITRRAKATAQANRERGMIHRQLAILPTWWYPVDRGRRLIINQPRRKRWEIYAPYGVDARRDSGRAHVAGCLGFAQLPAGQALVLAAICDGAKTVGQIAGKTVELAKHLRIGEPPQRRTLYSFLHHLRRAGLITSFMNYGTVVHCVHHAQRGPVCPVIAVRGRDLLQPEFAEFTRDTLPADALDTAPTQDLEEAA